MTVCRADPCTACLPVRLHELMAAVLPDQKYTGKGWHVEQTDMNEQAGTAYTVRQNMLHYSMCKAQVILQQQQLQAQRPMMISRRLEDDNSAFYMMLLSGRAYTQPPDAFFNLRVCLAFPR